MFTGAEKFLGVGFILSRFLARSVPIEVRSDQDVGGKMLAKFPKKINDHPDLAQ